MAICRPGDADLVRAHWNAPNLAAGPGLKAVDLFRAIADKTVRAVWIIATNPAISLPEAAAIRQALRSCDTVVISECVRASDTVDLAGIRLPALGWGEKDGTVTNSERVITRQRPFLPAPGQARPDWWIMAQVATRMGFGPAFAWNWPCRHLPRTRRPHRPGNDGARLFDISGLSPPSTTPPTKSCPPPAGRIPRRAPPTPACSRWRRRRPPPSPPNGPPPAAPHLQRLPADPQHRPHPRPVAHDDAHRKIHPPARPPPRTVPDDPPRTTPDRSKTAALAMVQAQTGHAVLRARIDPGQRPGSVFAPMHWTDRFCPAGRINPVVNAEVDPLSGQPELKHTPVQHRPLCRPGGTAS